MSSAWKQNIDINVTYVRPKLILKQCNIKQHCNTGVAVD